MQRTGGTGRTLAFTQSATESPGRVWTQEGHGLTYITKRSCFGQVEDKMQWVMWRSLLNKQEHLYLDFLPKIIHPVMGVGKARAAVSTLSSRSRHCARQPQPDLFLACP